MSSVYLSYKGFLNFMVQQESLSRSFKDIIKEIERRFPEEHEHIHADVVRGLRDKFIGDLGSDAYQKMVNGSLYFNWLEEAYRALPPEKA
jgi:hypothetical protein